MLWHYCYMNVLTVENKWTQIFKILICSFKKYLVYNHIGTDVIQAGTVVWRFFVSGNAWRLAPDQCFPMRCHRWNMASAMHTDDDTLENTGELFFIRGTCPPETPKKKIKNCRLVFSDAPSSLIHGFCHTYRWWHIRKYRRTIVRQGRATPLPLNPP